MFDTVLQTFLDDPLPPLAAQSRDGLDVFLRRLAPTGLRERSQPDVESLQLLGQFGVPLEHSGLDVVLLLLFRLDLACLVQQEAPFNLHMTGEYQPSLIS